MIEPTLAPALVIELLAGAGLAAVGLVLYRRFKAMDDPNKGRRLSGPQSGEIKALPKSDAEIVAAAERRILDMHPGDIVEHYGETYLVDGRLLYDEEGTVWKTYLLSGDDGKDRWLSVDDDDRITIAMYEVLPTGSVDVPDPPPKSLTVGTITFQLQERGTARVRKHDQHGTRDRGKCRYADYIGPDGNRMSVEWWGEVPEVALGKPIKEHELLVMPGS